MSPWRTGVAVRPSTKGRAWVRGGVLVAVGGDDDDEEEEEEKEEEEGSAAGAAAAFCAGRGALEAEAPVRAAAQRGW